MTAFACHGPGATTWEEVPRRGVDANHRVTLDQMEEASDVFGQAAGTGALKMVLSRS